MSRVSVTLRGHPILRDIDLSIGAGELVALAGPSGAGKTTLLRAAAGLVPHGGLIESAETALVFQQHALARRLSARDNVLVGALARIGFVRSALRAWPADERRRAASCLAEVGLAGLGHRRADTLSGGQRQRVAIARALAQGAPVLLADEPVASLDPENADAIMRLLRALADQGHAVLVCLHQPDLARRFADRTLRMSDGRLHGAP